MNNHIFTGCQQLSHLCPFLFLLILGETCQTKRLNLTENPVKSPRLPSSNTILCFLGLFPCLFCTCQKPKDFLFSTEMQQKLYNVTLEVCFLPLECYGNSLT